MENQKLSANVQRAPLLQVIQELQRATGINFSYSNLPNIYVTEQFDRLNLDDGIKRILPVNTIFLYSDSSTGGNPSQTIDTVFILTSIKDDPKKQDSDFPQSFLSDLEPAPSPKEVSKEAQFRHDRYQKGIAALLRQAEDYVTANPWMLQLQDERPAKRLVAALALGDLGSDIAMNALYMALGDRNPEVKTAAASQLKQINENRYYQSLKKDLDNPSKEVQEQALAVIRLKSGEKWERLLEETIAGNRFSEMENQKAKLILREMKEKRESN